MENLKVPILNPKPDFKEFRKVIEGEKRARRVHFVELLMDMEVKVYIKERYMGEKWIEYSEENKENFWQQEIDFWYKLGYDYVRIAGGLNFVSKGRKTQDTAFLSRGVREWTEEGKGMITNWEEFEKYPWPSIKDVDFSFYEYVSKNLPDGMKMMVCPSSGVFEIVSEALLGFENMSYLIFDNFQLVEATFNRVGQLMYEFYQNIVEMENVEGFFQGDDMGYKTSTIISPELLRKLVLPWHKKFAELAHKYNKMYWLHCCGNVLELMDDFIEDVKIDAFHSFQDEIIPVVEFKKIYGEKIGVLGGVDVDKLSLLEEKELRRYVRGIIEECMPERFALGSGNSIANYIPPENFLIMLDEGLRWND